MGTPKPNMATRPRRTSRDRLDSVATRRNSLDPTPPYNTGDRVRVVKGTAGDSEGTIQACFKQGTKWWVGVELDEPSGKNDGLTSHGERYFTCKMNHGIYVKADGVCRDICESVVPCQDICESAAAADSELRRSESVVPEQILTTNGSALASTMKMQQSSIPAWPAVSTKTVQCQPTRRRRKSAISASPAAKNGSAFIVSI